MRQRGTSDATRYAAIDVGSNSVKLRIAVRTRQGEAWQWHVAHDEVVVTGLGRGLTTRRTLDPAVSATTLGVLRGFAEIIAAHNCAGVVAVATQCLREAADGAAFAADAGRRTGLALEIISGQEEARLAFLGACSELPADVAGKDLVVVDVGGRSTEFGFGRPDQIADSSSLAVGVLGLTERYLGRDPVVAADVAAARVDADERLAGLPAASDPGILIGIGATPATLAAVQRGVAAGETATLHGYCLPRAEVARQIELYAGLSLSQRRELPGLHPDRAGVILAGAILVASAMDRLRCHEMRVSIHGLRQGLLRDRYEEPAS
jgi:exopolyphosphatase / guanosine-5'-triphosphate,3'-diphosphate pyrophosphatase